MKATLFAASALLAVLPAGAAAASSAGPAARAADKPSVPVVVPDPATAGAAISVFDGDNCTGTGGTATSPAFAAPIALANLANMIGGTGALKAGLAPGTYDVTLKCGNTLTTTVRVVAATANRSVPNGAAQTGDGSAAEDHLGVGDFAVGTAMVVGGIAFGTVALIRKKRAGAGARG